MNADIVLGELSEINNNNTYSYCKNAPILLYDYEGFVWVMGAYAPFYGFYHLEVQSWIVLHNPHIVMEQNTSTGRIDLYNTITTEIYEVKPWNEFHISSGIAQLERYSKGELPSRFGYSMLLLPPDGTLHYEYPNTTVDVIVRKHGPLITNRLNITRKKRQKEYEEEYHMKKSPAYSTQPSPAPAIITILGIALLVITLLDPIPGDEALAFGAILAMP